MAVKKNSIELPSKLTKSSWFYEKHKELVEPHLGKYYISYSSVNSWEEYKEEFIKEKLAKIELPASIYADMGSYLGEAVETGKFSENNPHGFTGQENFGLVPRPKNGVYERMILLDMGDYVIIGFIDIYEENDNKVRVLDLKTGGKDKEDYYKSKDYTQVMLYAKALEMEGKEIEYTGIWFVRRTGSHVNPPLHISDEQFAIPLEYNEERVKYALDKVDRVVGEISEMYKVYKKYFE